MATGRVVTVVLATGLVTACAGPSRTAADVRPVRVSAFAPLLAAAPDDAFAIVGADLDRMRLHPTTATYLESVRIRMPRSSRPILDATSRVALVYAPSRSTESPASPDVSAEEARVAEALSDAFEPAEERLPIFDSIAYALDVEPSWVTWSTAIVLASPRCADLGDAELVGLAGRHPGEMRFRHLSEGLCAFGDADLIDRFEERSTPSTAARGFAELEATAADAPALLATLDRSGPVDPVAYREPPSVGSDDPDDFGHARYRARMSLREAFEVQGDLRDVAAVSIACGFGVDGRFAIAADVRLADADAAALLAITLRRRFDAQRASYRAERQFVERHPDANEPVAIDGGLPARIPPVRALVEAFQDPAIDHEYARVRITLVEERVATAERLVAVRDEVDQLVASEEGRVVPGRGPTDEERERADDARADLRARRRIMNGVQNLSSWPIERRLEFLDDDGPAIDALVGTGATQLLRARTFVDAGDFAAAESTIAAATAAGVDDSFGGVRVAIAWERGDRAALESASPSASRTLLLARMHALEGDFDAAVRLLDAVSLGAAGERARIELELMRGRLDVAVALVAAQTRSFAAAAPDEEPPPLPCWLHVAKAIADVRRGVRPDVDDAVESCRAQRTGDPVSDAPEVDVDVCELLSLGDPSNEAARARCEATLEGALGIRHPAHADVIRSSIALSRFAGAGVGVRARARGAIDRFPAGSPIRRHYEWMFAGHPPIRPTRAPR